MAWLWVYILIKFSFWVNYSFKVTIAGYYLLQYRTLKKKDSHKRMKSVTSLVDVW